MTEKHDVCIVGAGIVGTALACALAESGLRVALADRGPLTSPIPPPQATARVSALTLASCEVLRRLGAWPELIASGVAAFRKMEVWDASGAGRLEFDSAWLSEPTLGYIVADHLVRNALMTRLRLMGNVRLISPAELDGIECRDRQVACRFGDVGKVEAKLVVGADGASSRVRTLMGIQTRGLSYGQKAIISTVHTQHWHQETAWQRFLPGGPVAFLPMADGRCSIVWSVPSARADELVAMDDVAFAYELEQAFDTRLGEVSNPTPRLSFPLSAAHVREYVRPRVALIGDAAHRIHPLAGQGLNLGLLDAAALAEVIIEARQAGNDIGAFSALRRFERWRKRDNTIMLAAVDGLSRLFRGESAPIVWLRGLGLTVINGSEIAKTHIMRHAMGLRPQMPELARRRTDDA